METDNQLLAEYALRSNEAAFRELVQRHLNMVHSAALRETAGNMPLAEDITQEVFTDLARRAETLASHPAIAGWLYTSVRLTAANVRRANHRRQKREQEAFNMNELAGSGESNALWRQVRPVLDDVMHELDQEDREVVVLRFFEGHTHKEVGNALGLTENAARMRVDRSLQKLHELLSRRGIHSTAGTLAAVLVVAAATTASPSFAATVATGAMAAAAGKPAALGGTTLATAVKTKIAAACALALVATAVVLWWQRQSNAIPPTAQTAATAPAAVAPGINQTASNTMTTTQPLATGTNAVAARQMALQIVDADSGDPLAGTKLHLAYFLAAGRSKVVHAVTDAEGRLAVDMPAAPYGDLNMFVTADGHVPKVTSWGFNRAMPTAYTMKLERGATLSGVVVDEAGAPIAGAKLEFDCGGNDPSLAENIQFGSDATVSTDDLGHWLCNMIPRDMKQLTLIATANGHVATNLPIQRELLDASPMVITMMSGFTVSGTIQDPNGNPVSGASVRQPQLNGEHERSTSTDEAGAFTFKSMPGGELSLVVQADGLAPIVKTLQVTGNLATVQFQLAPGRLLRGSVTDEAGNPVTNALVETTGGGIDWVRWSTNTDASGRFEWNSAPVEPLPYSVLAEGFNRSYPQTIPADGAEHVIKLTTHQPVKDDLHLTGTAVDADTGAPLDGFKVLVSDQDPEWAFPWQFYTDGQEGKFAFSMAAHINHPAYQVQIEKDGYLPGTSAVLQRANGNQKLEFALHKGLGPRGAVYRPDGRPAADATVLLCTPTAGVTLDRPAQVQKGINTTTYVAKTDEAGRFSLAPASQPQGLIIVHDAGYVDVSLADLAANSSVTLQPWGGVKGRLMAGSQPAANQHVAISGQTLHYSDNGRQFGYLTFRFKTTTDSNGEFSFEKVPPGPCVISQEILATFQLVTSHNTQLTVTPGTVTNVVLGGKGRSVIGEAILSGSAVAVNWPSVSMGLSSKAGAEPGPRPDRKNFPTVDAYVAAQQSYVQAWGNREHISGLCDHDGKFQLLDVPPGPYELNITIRAGNLDTVAPHDFLEGYKVVDSLVRDVVVPDDGSSEPLDLGALELMPAKTNSAPQ